MLFRFAFASLIILSSSWAAAGTVISTNLPANTWIVNIDGRNDGAATYDGDQSNWYQPFAIDGNLLELTLAAGTYRFTLVDSAEAQAAFPNLTSSQLSQIGAGWTFNSPWITDYMVFDSSAVNDHSQAQLFSGGIQKTSYGSAADAHAGAKAAGTLDQLVVSPGGRYHGTLANSFTLDQTRTLIFIVPDYYLPDNNGTVSVAVQAVPEPATIAGLAAGGLALLRRKRR